MAHYAFLDENNVVTEVIGGRGENETVNGISDWETYYGELRGQTCKRTSYNTKGGVHLDGGEPFRYNYAGVGFTFDSEKGTDGAFIPPQPFDSWLLDEETCLWVSPVPLPDDADIITYTWDENVGDWVEVTEA